MDSYQAVRLDEILNTTVLHCLTPWESFENQDIKCSAISFL